MKEFGKLTIKKGTVLLLDEKKNTKGGYWTETMWTCHIKRSMKNLCDLSMD